MYRQPNIHRYLIQIMAMKFFAYTITANNPAVQTTTVYKLVTHGGVRYEHHACSLHQQKQLFKTGNDVFIISHLLSCISV